MNKVYVTLFGVCLALSIVACKSRKPSKSESDTFYLEFSKTPCFGKCPIYNMSVNNNGDLLLNAKRFMALEGQYNAVLHQDTLIALVNKIKAIEWSELDAEYLTGYSDLPATEVKYSVNAGDTIFVRWESNKAPKTLLELGENLESIQKNTKWDSVDLD